MHKYTHALLYSIFKIMGGYMEKFKIGSFNLFNLVLPEHKYYGNKKYSAEEYALKKEWIRKQITKMDAKIVGFQEVFHKEALVDVLDGSMFENGDIHVLDETGKSPVVGLATTYPLVGDAKSIVNIPADVVDPMEVEGSAAKFSRPVLKAQIELPSDTVLTVFVSHLKSKRPSIQEGEDKNDFTVKAVGQARSLVRRAIEATGLRSLIVQELSENDNPVMVLGDLNDSTRSVSSSIVAGPTPWKFDSMDKKKEYWDRALYSTFDIISQKSFKKEWPTHIYNGHYEALDHIYVSQEFYFRNKNRIGNVDFVHILSDHLKDDTLSRDKLPKWKSDHGQVVATMSPYKKRECCR